MRVVFAKLAQQELDDASFYYEVELQGLGKRFRKEVGKAVRRIHDTLKHGPWNEAKCENAFFISFRTSSCIPLRVTTSLLLLLCTSTENRIIGLKDIQDNKADSADSKKRHGFWHLKPVKLPGSEIHNTEKKQP